MACFIVLDRSILFVYDTCSDVLFPSSIAVLYSDALALKSAFCTIIVKVIMNLLLSDGMNMQEGAVIMSLIIDLFSTPRQIMFIRSHILMQECRFGSKLGQTP